MSPTARRRRPPESPPDGLVLAAADRAQRHFVRPGEAVPPFWIAEHLGLPWHSGTSRRLHPVLHRLRDAGQLETGRLYGRDVWRVTSAGRRQLARLQRTGEAGALPESPQHREWREARRAASRRIEKFRRDVCGLLDRAVPMLAAGDDLHSDEWLVLGDDLHRACRRLGCATHCLREWPEPHDHTRDIDSCREPGDRKRSPTQRFRRRALRHSRRATRLWDFRVPPTDPDAGHSSRGEGA